MNEGHAGKKASAFPSFQMRNLIDLNAAITHFAERLRPKAGDRTSVRMELDPNSGKIAAGPEQVDWLLVNLVADAYDGLPGGGEVTITTANVELNPTTAAEMELPPAARMCKWASRQQPGPWTSAQAPARWFARCTARSRCKAPAGQAS